MSKSILQDRTWKKVWKMEPDSVNYKHAFPNQVPWVKGGLQYSGEYSMATERRS